MFRVVIPLFAVVVALAGGPAAKGGDGCQLFGEIAVEAVKARATQVCVVSGHPVACAIAAALNTAAGDGIAKHLVTESCDWTVERVGNVLKVTIKADDKHAETAKKAQEELKKAKEYHEKPSK
jgi:hypothetical protein